MTRFVYDNWTCKAQDGSCPWACKVGRAKWLVGVEFRPLLQKDHLPKEMPKEAYFVVIKKGANYLLTGVSLHGSRHCERRRDDDP